MYATIYIILDPIFDVKNLGSPVVYLDSELPLIICTYTTLLLNKNVWIYNVGTYPNPARSAVPCFPMHTWILRSHAL